MLRTKPLSQTNFEPTEEAAGQGVQRVRPGSREDVAVPPDAKFPVHEKKNYTPGVVHESDTAEMAAFFDCEFQLVLALVQMPHLDINAEFERIKGSPLTTVERGHLDRRVHAAKYFIASLASPEERLTLQTSPPAKASELTPVQRLPAHAGGEAHPLRWRRSDPGRGVRRSTWHADRPAHGLLGVLSRAAGQHEGPEGRELPGVPKAREDLVRLFSAVPLDETGISRRRR